MYIWEDVCTSVFGGSDGPAVFQYTYLQEEEEADAVSVTTGI